MPINNDKTREAQKIWDALSPMISSLVSRSTRSCVRARKMQVMEPADGRFLAVAEPYGKTIRVPYSAALQDVQVGSAVWVIWFFDNASTMIAVATGAGQIIPDYDSVATPFILASDPPVSAPDKYTVWLDVGVTPPVWRLWKGENKSTDRTAGGWDLIGPASEGGGGITGDYLNLTHKPSINSVTLQGDVSLAAIGAQPAGDYLSQTTADDLYVAQEAGKTLTSNDYTNEEKAKLANIEAGAQANVQSDWSAASGDAAILNKPQIPSATSDLTNDSGFISSESDPTVPSWAKQATKPTYTASEVGALPDSTAIPTKTSDLTNDSGFLTAETDPTVPAWAKAASKPSYTAAEVGALPDDTAIPSKTSDLTNDSGFLTSESDPTVPAWAKASSKPTYTAAEVGALPDTTVIPVNTSDLNNDSGFISAESDPTVPSWAKQASKPSYTASEVGALPDTTPIPTNTSDLNNDSGFITSVPDMTGATGSSAGTAGLVPAPAAGDNTKFLRGDGTWQQAGGGGLSFDDIYPVGSIYMSVNSTNPGTLFGGTWTQIQDTFLLAAGSTYTAGATGGSASHLIEKTNLPSNVNGTVNFRGHNGTQNLVTYASGVFTSSSQTNTSTIPTTAAGSSNVHYSQLKFNLGGDDTPLDTMPPYLAVYVWQRTA